VILPSVLTASWESLFDLMTLIPESLEQWLDHIQSIHFRSRVCSLDRVRRVRHILRLVRPPIVITVGGTNGKGSSVAILESVLQSAGRKVGTYTSPHLIEYQERIRISGRNVNKALLVNAFTAVEGARQTIPLTFFEFGTLAALWIFQQARVEVAILEVGMGGRLDAVNTEVADVVLLTPIAIDHEQWLGSGTEQIGAEKAGILKFNGGAVINDSNAPNSVMDRVHYLRCKCLQYGHDYVAQPVGDLWHWQTKKSTMPWLTDEKGLPTPSLPGKHQVVNAAGAVAVLKLLRTKMAVPKSALMEGLSAQSIRGRLEVYSSQPEVIVDVCHNVSAADRLMEFLTERPVTGCTFGVFSMLRDKPAAAVVERFRGTIGHWYIAELHADRALPLVELEKIILLDSTVSVSSWSSPTEAFHNAREHAEPNDRIVVFGSVYLAGVILQTLDHESTQA
jgi:dihydrofolate synthase/folylpolyglutamate synthase